MDTGIPTSLQGGLWLEDSRVAWLNCLLGLPLCLPAPGCANDEAKDVEEEVMLEEAPQELNTAPGGGVEREDKGLGANPPLTKALKDLNSKLGGGALPKACLLHVPA